jgi:hypothetical protein
MVRITWLRAGFETEALRILFLTVTRLCFAMKYLAHIKQQTVYAKRLLLNGGKRLTVYNVAFTLCRQVQHKKSLYNAQTNLCVLLCPSQNRATDFRFH